MTNLRYAIVGAGAIGSYYGARLQQSGRDVHFLLRSDYEQVRESGLAVESIDGDFVLSDVNAYDNPNKMPPADVAIVALKTTHNHRIAELLPKMNPGGAVVFFQNGLGIETEASQYLDPSIAVLGGLCFICVNRVMPGHIRHLEYGRVLLGAHNIEAHNNSQQPCTTPLVKSIAADFRQANVETETTEDLPMARWKKLVWNVPYNGLSVVLNATTDEMMADAGVRSLITTLMQEVVTVANAWGDRTSPSTHRNISFDWVDNMLAHTDAMKPYRTSMKIDYDQRRPLEIKAIVGKPLEEAKRLKVSVPAISMLYQQLVFLDQRNTAG